MIRNTKLVHIFFILILASGCNKTAAELAPIQTNIFEFEAEKILTDAEPVNEERVPESTALLIHDLLPGIEIEEIPADNLDPLIADFLSEYFQNDDYVLWEPPLDAHYRKIHIAVHYILKFTYADFFYRTIFDKAVGFEITDEGIVPYLYVKDFQFIDKDGTVFIDLRKALISRTRELFGFDFYYSFDISGVKPSGLGIDTYFDNGNGIADTFSIYWNEENKTFEEKPYF